MKFKIEVAEEVSILDQVHLIEMRETLRAHVL
jgi:hypothetical protein